MKLANRYYLKRSIKNRLQQIGISLSVFMGTKMLEEIGEVGMLDDLHVHSIQQFSVILREENVCEENGIAIDEYEVNLDLTNEIPFASAERLVKMLIHERSEFLDEPDTDWCIIEKD